MQQVKNEKSYPFVSLIIPTRNEEKMIVACYRAIRELDYDAGRFEVVVVDNGSTDQTRDVAQQCGASVFTMGRSTISALRNLGVKRARGEILAFIDADCLLDREWLKKALGHFKDPAVGCVGCYTIIPAESSWVQRAWALQNKKEAHVEEVDWLPSRSILVRREAFERIGGFNESLITCEDADFCYRLRKANYKIISDHSLKSIHLGEARTLSDFFKKERWRGQSNLRGVLSHGFYAEEIPSLAIPIFYLVSVLALLISAVHSLKTGQYTTLIVNLALVMLPALLLALRRSVRVGEFNFIGELTLLYLVSSLARTSAMLPIKQDDGHRDANVRAKI